MLSEHEIAAAVLDVDAALMALGCEQFEAEGGTWVRDREFPSIYDANHVTAISASSAGDVERLITRAEEEFAHCNHRRFHVDFRTSPLVTARLALDGYTRDDTLLMVLEGALQGSPKDIDIRPIESEQCWEAYASLKAADWAEHRQTLPEPRPGPEIGEGFVHIYRRKSPDVRYFLAYMEGRPVAFFSSWPGIGGIGQVEDLFTTPEYRHRGIATSLIHHCVQDCRERGAKRVVIACSPTDTPKNMYRAMGFAPVALAGHYLKRLAAAGPA